MIKKEPKEEKCLDCKGTGKNIFQIRGNDLLEDYRKDWDEKDCYEEILIEKIINCYACQGSGVIKNAKRK